MSRTSALFLGLVLAASGGRSEACINDSELKTHEREFRSQYGGAVELAEPARPRSVPSHVLFVSGLVLVGWAFTIAVRRDLSKG